MRIWSSLTLAAALGALTLSSCAALPGGTPSASPTSATASPTAVRTDVSLKTNTGKVTLKVRHVPTSNGNELAKIPTGTTILVDCQVKGSVVAGTQGSTDVWNHLSYLGVSGYVSAAYVEGGTSNSVPACPYTAKIADQPLPLPTATPGTDVRATVVAIASSQLGAAEHAVNCNPYSKKCEEWSTHFAVWVLQKAGVKVNDMVQSVDLYAWAKKNGRAHDGLDGIKPGDIVLTGSGPSVKTSTRADIVIAVFPNRLRVIGGNSDDRVNDREVPLTGLYGWVASG